MSQNSTIDSTRIYNKNDTLYCRKCNPDLACQDEFTFNATTYHYQRLPIPRTRNLKN